MSGSSLLHLSNDTGGTSSSCHDVCEAVYRARAFSIWRRRFSVVKLGLSFFCIAR